MSKSILDVMHDPRLFASWFKDRESWRAWEAFLAALFALPMNAELEALYRKHTERTAFPTTPAREAWVIAGRRGGKSLIAALAAIYLAAFRDYRDVLAPGEVGTLAVIAADRRQARTVMRYIVGFLENVPMLRELVTGRAKESIELNNRIVIEVHTASFRAVRGYTLVAVVLDEVAFFQNDESAADPDREILTGLRPGLATTGGLLLAISSPYSRKGVLWENHQQHFGVDGDPVLVWQGTSQEMNPTIDAAFIAAEYEKDPASAAAEWGATFRTDVESFVSREVVEAAVVLDRRELPPCGGVTYRAFVDPSGGSSDSMTLAIAHREDKNAVLDLVREVKPPFSPKDVVQEFADVLMAYRCTSVVGDRYSGEWVREAFREVHISYVPSEKSKSEIYGETLPLLNCGQVELLDAPRLTAQLLGLERRTSRNGKDSIDHGPKAHDDVCNSACGALLLCGKPAVKPMSRAFGGVSLMTGGLPSGWD